MGEDELGLRCQHARGVRRLHQRLRHPEHCARRRHGTHLVYYESRLIKLELKTSWPPRLGPEFEEVIESEEVKRREKFKSKWT